MSDPSSSDISKIATLAYYWDLFGSNVSPGRISKQLAVFYYTQCNGPGLPLVRSNQNFPTIVIQSYHLKAFHAPSRSWCTQTDQPVLHFCNLTGKLLVHVLYTKNISRGKMPSTIVYWILGECWIDVVWPKRHVPICSELTNLSLSIWYAQCPKTFNLPWEYMMLRRELYPPFQFE